MAATPSPRVHQSHGIAVAAHALAVVVGLTSFGAGILALSKSLPAVMGVTMIVIGILMPALAHLSWRFSRAAWSMMISTLTVFAAVTFFGSPKIAAILHVGMAVALVIPIIQVVAVIALADLRGEYSDQ
jgi:hypothetical protein